MKRFAAALLAISLVLGLSACSSPAPELQEFTDGVHERDEVYPAHIETKSVALGGLGIHFSTSAFDETASPELAQKVAEDYSALSGAGEADIYILNGPLTDATFVSGAELFCTAEAVESGEYRPALVSAALSIPGRWQAEGLSRELFGGEVPDADAASAHVLRLCTGLDRLLDYLETNAPESWARIEQTRPYEVRFEENIDASCTDVYSAVVHLRAPSAGLHELAHALTIDEPCGEAGWVFEGVAMHCTEWWISYEDYGIFFDLMENIDTVEGASEDERFIFGEIRRIFKELSGVDASEAQTLESPAIPLVKAMTYAMLLHPERDVFIKMVSKPTGDVMSSFYEPRYPSTELSHAKSYAFCEYLLEHGYLTFDQLAAASLDLEGYRAAFPTDEYFDELYAGYLDWLREEFGS